MSEQVIVRRNVLTNPSFEVDALGWSGAATRSTGTAGRAYAGTYYGGTGASNISESGKSPAAAGQTWTASGYFSRGASAKSVTVQPVFFDASGTELSVTTPASHPILASNTPERFSDTRTAPAGTTQVALRLTANGVITFDAMMLAQTDVLWDYFDGSTLLEGHTFAWTGTAHASASTDTYTVIVPDPPAGVVLRHRMDGVWVEATAVPKVFLDGAWVTAYPKRYGADGTWTDL
jgi:hypothetical protein